MGIGNRFTITLTGGSPWGFRLFGGETIPLQVAKVRKKSKADLSGIEEGDEILSINGILMSGKSHEDAMFLVDNAGSTLAFELSRGGKRSQPAQVVNGHDVTLQADDRNPQNLRASPVSFGQRSQSPYQQQIKVPTPSSSLRSSPITNRTPSPFQPKVTKSSFTNVKGNTTTHFQTRQYQDQTADGKQKRIVFQQRQTITHAPEFHPKVATQSSPNVWQPKQFYSKENVSPVKVPNFSVRNIKNTIMASPTSVKQGPPLPPKPLQERKHFEKNIHVFDSYDRQYFPDPCMFSHDYHFPEVKMIDDDDEIIDTHPHEDEFHHHQSHLPVFAPKVEISYEDFVNEQNLYNQQMGHSEIPPAPPLPPLPIRRVVSLPESEGTCPGTPDTESTGFTMRKKKMYSDSAFFDTPESNYPTIEEQMELCKKIAQSLTSAANRKARGAKMFAKRKRKSAKWIHDEETKASSAGDIADLRDLDSEFIITDGGAGPLFTFRIPNIKARLAVTDPEGHKMSLSQDEFERLRLNKKRCDHRVVSPNTCHSLVADLQSPKNRGAKLFQKRQARSEKWVIDESNAKRPDIVHRSTRLETMLSPKPTKSPWEAAMDNPLGTVDGAFNHLDHKDNLQQINRSLQHVGQFSPQPVSVPYGASRPKTKLVNTSELELLQGEDFNRKARGWCPVQQTTTRTETRTYTQSESYPQQTFRENPPLAPMSPVKQENYNRKIRAWNSGPQTSNSSTKTETVKRTVTTESNYGTHPGRNQKKTNYSYSHQQTMGEIPGSDL